MTVSELVARLDLKVFCGEGNPGSEVTGCYCGDLLSWVMARAAEGNAWVTIMSNINVAAVMAMADIACVILAESVEPDAGLLKRACSEGLILLVSNLSTFEISWRLHDAFIL
jgi:serine kinase of HPr protein (carbohydrate metabolism regulator)